MKGELARETVNYDAKTMYQFEPKCNLLRSTLQVKQHFPETVVRRFLKISWTPQESICVSVCWPATLLKRDFNIGVFLWNLQNFKNTLIIWKLQWLLLRFKFCFQRSSGQKPMHLSPIRTRFSWKRYLPPRKSRSSYHRCSVKEGLQLY